MADSSLMIGGDLVLYGSVGGDFWDDSGFTAVQVVAALAGQDGDLIIRVNSYGGIATEGAAIHAVLSAYPGRKTVRVEGIAASAASLIAMAGDEIVMTPGALMMVHDPAGWTMGNSEAHRDSADMLDKMGDTYAAVYAKRAGITVEQARAIMRAETWFSPEDAVAAGFATSVAEDALPMAAAAFDYTVFARAPEKLRAYATLNGWLRQSPAAGAAATPKENTMTVEPKAAALEPAVIVSTASLAPEMKADPETARIVADAKRRKAVVDRFGADLSAAQVDEIVMSAKDDAAAVMAAADIVIGARMKAEGPATPIRITRDEVQTDLDGMVGALGVHLFGGRLEGPAEKFRGLTMKRLAMHLAGGEKFGWSEHELVKRGMGARGVVMSSGMTGTSDFTYITGSLMNRALRDAYASNPGTWRRISRQRTATDFRTLYSVQAGVNATLKEVKQTGEYEGTVLSDNGESFAVKRYGRKVLLTFEAVINDDMSAFARLPGDFARAATNLESGICWGLINTNGNMSDSVALFASGHGNLAGSGAAISVTTVGTARQAMMEQRPLGALSTGDDFIAAVPNLLVVPPALETVALQFTAATVAVTDSTTNPFKGTLETVVEPRLGTKKTGGSNTAWYLFDSRLPTLEHAFLSGYEAPMIESMDETDPRGVKMIAEHIFGAGVVEFRGAYKNAGA